MLKYLLNKGADINEMDNEGKTQLMSLIRRSLFEANKNNLLVKGPNTKNNLINVREYFNKHLDNLDIFRSLNNNGDRLVNGERSTRILFLQIKDDNVKFINMVDKGNNAKNKFDSKDLNSDIKKIFKNIALGCYSNQDCWGRFKNNTKYSLIKVKNDGNNNNLYLILKFEDEIYTYSFNSVDKNILLMNRIHFHSSENLSNIKKIKYIYIYIC